MYSEHRFPLTRLQRDFLKAILPYCKFQNSLYTYDLLIRNVLGNQYYIQSQKEDLNKVGNEFNRIYPSFDWRYQP